MVLQKADVTSSLGFEAAISQLARDPPNIRDINDNINKETWTNFSLEVSSFRATPFPLLRGEKL